ncbi:MAG: aminotransferase class IV [Bacteroidota bacterium]|nr:aminotransferase class IV [Bacteroidota bacterium]MDP4232239.1 aminotransferase class IV [Bacteroidota bacterium]MDP4243582.1 aminotransferase class IV [Bacteroidota bacterium]MDP4289117.1 aminotransferase class IV [Bacteroidota bacterium]
MSLLFEAIRVQDGAFRLLELHAERMNASRKALLGLDDPISLRGLTIPDECKSGRFKCRIEYGREIERVTFEGYIVALPERFQLVRDDAIQYSHKLTDRQRLLALMDSAAPDGIIIVKHGFITDAYHANIAFSDGERWVTPDTPLLAGRMREWLLRTGQISPATIRDVDLANFKSFKLINAMLGFEESPEFGIDRIVTRPSILSHGHAI